MCYSNIHIGVEEIDLWLRVIPCLSEDINSLLNTHVGWLKNIYSSSSRVIRSLCFHPLEPAFKHMHMCAGKYKCTHTQHVCTHAPN